ncbi:hypothetical protein VC83_08346 [Pseudogymnoascus destructans]|uniref:Uncharacterized protein n=2 Tax=Pseudogymnoascus destructans TaxID=655981 RepID=L8G5A1_PSED2|nr:uncharacterized protein VC83_08346 [Pseudogymnoascus destructans]ELR08307.1 hypothetical protein GMDG_03105 [Pseudogymnoascus destructans 20631-21]OAF55435.1 hypothetical protein VC83_08346 [Pseudogymnoascus destructans]
MDSPAILRQRKRSDYPYVLTYRTRWSDNDMYDHLNNSIYNFLIDSVINTYLSQHCGQSPRTSAQYGLVASSHTDFLSSLAFPAVAETRLRVHKLGRTSVTYEVGVWEEGVEGIKAVGRVVHVFVERGTGRPARDGMGTVLRGGLEKLSWGERGKL